MKNFKNILTIVAATLCMLVMVVVNIQIGLNDGTDADIHLLGADITIFQSAYANVEPPGDLSCDDHSNCKDGASCDGTGTHSGPCSFDCDKGPEVDCKFNQE